MTAPEAAGVKIDTASRLSMAVDVVAAFVTNNKILQNDLIQLIEKVYETFANIDGKSDAIQLPPPEPKVPIKKSVQSDYIICLEDGQKFRSMKRHLQTKYNMTPDQYKARWNLPADYPMVAPAYSAARSQLAKASGLGQLRAKAKAAAQAASKAPKGATRKAGRATKKA